MKTELITLISIFTISGLVFAEDCKTYAEKLENCTAFTCEYSHPMFKQVMKKSIVGIKNGKCETTEEMPNNGRLDCLLSPQSQKGIVKQLKEASSQPVTGDTKVRMNLNSGSTTVNGKSVDSDPLNTAMSNGECRVSGYEE
jgi:hypothetical protein